MAPKDTQISEAEPSFRRVCPSGLGEPSPILGRSPDGRLPGGYRMGCPRGDSTDEGADGAAQDGRRPGPEAGGEAGGRGREVWGERGRRIGLGQEAEAGRDEGPPDEEGPGADPKLDPRDLAGLPGLLLRGAREHGWSTDLWTTQGVADLFETEFGVRYHRNHVWRLLAGDRLLLAAARPEGPGEGRGPEAGMASDHLVQGEKKLRSGATVVIVDESGFSATPSVARTWAPVGETPVLVHPFHWERLSAISGVAVRIQGGPLRARMYFRLHPGENGERGGGRGVPVAAGPPCKGPLVVAWDNGRPHRWRVVDAFLARHPRFQAGPLPPYCPELNPDEGVWKWVKTRDLPNLCAHDRERVSRSGIPAQDPGPRGPPDGMPQGIGAVVGRLNAEVFSSIDNISPHEPLDSNQNDAGSGPRPPQGRHGLPPNPRRNPPA